MVSDFTRLVVQMEEWMVGVSDRSQKDVWKRRVGKLTTDAEAYRDSLERQMGHVHRSRIELDKRKRLLGDTKGRGKIDNLLKEKEKIHEAHNMIDQMIEQGRGIVGMMSQQNSILRNARRRVYDIASGVGLSSSLVGVLDRMHVRDKMLVYGCMILTLIVFYGAYRFAKG
uniref:Vesicle transport v-SNARE N-terminal domain-containing protein n=1 Tax=Chromera velia CCMP2878 TaxID=1169474 RepID=A0A0G4F4R2_9ALVE|eukprot:Cvel_15202.t1-p1 / transcript=Cvel_15202.t1 / gene=Cvel_15202 / organism=Chromera_velia_CCMP2878 / gene_product=Membrin-11, putative / transcript_product=Membrin-11, putative / location=Cvel_scaffold1111:52418-54613(+) / protein_length=169 / sequence_SO=supercontig / SO=protein_coding / is_pseudo=false